VPIWQAVALFHGSAKPKVFVSFTTTQKVSSETLFISHFSEKKNLGIFR
jgi:hypothetical protein